MNKIQDQVLKEFKRKYAMNVAQMEQYKSLHRFLIKRTIELIEKEWMNQMKVTRDRFNDELEGWKKHSSLWLMHGEDKAKANFKELLWSWKVTYDNGTSFFEKNDFRTNSGEFFVKQLIKELDENKGCGDPFKTPLPKKDWIKCGDYIDGEKIFCKKCPNKKPKVYLEDAEVISGKDGRKKLKEFVKRNQNKKAMCKDCGHEKGWHTYNPKGKDILGDCYYIGCKCKKFIEVSK